MCKFTAFFDFTLATEYALLIITMAIILYTRKFPKLEDTLEELPMDRMLNHSTVHSPAPSYNYPNYNSGPQNPRRTPSRQSHNNSRPPSVIRGPAGGSRAPSVAGSVRSTNSAQPGFRPQRPNMLTVPKRPGSVTGSIEGRLATSTPTGRRLGQQFKASSPIQEDPDEEMDDLWDQASLDYPGNSLKF